MAHHPGLLSICLGEALAVDITSTTTPPRTRGWVSSPDGRGTLDIVWACLLTTFLCTWSSLHLNVPAPQDSRLKCLFRRVRWMIQAFLAPEYVVFLATIQKIEAQRSCDEWKNDGYPFWTMYHGFFANMGGFVLQPPDIRPFPINSKQLLYLVKHDYTSVPEITQSEISNKGKQDGFQKFLTLLQLFWFVLQCVGRAIQHLPTTTLELATIGLVICTFASYYEWSCKPLDIEHPVVIPIRTRIAEILIDAGSRARMPYLRTPLDFVDDQFPSWLTRIQPFFAWRIFGPPERPLPRFTNDRLPTIDGSRDSILLVIVVMAYSGLHFIAWDFIFPTQVERIIWRVNCIVMVSTASIFFASEFYHNELRTGRWLHGNPRLFSMTPPLRRLLSKLEGAKLIPSGQNVFILVFAVMYTLARMYIAIECFISLRSLPLRAFDSVKWSNFIPHYG